MMKKFIRKSWKSYKTFYLAFATFAAFCAVALLLPTLLVWRQGYQSSPPRQEPFPVTVNPSTKTITEDPVVEAMFVRENTPLAAAVVHAGGLFDIIAATIASTPVYRMLAGASATRVVILEPGYRKEQVVQAFAEALGWDAAAQKAFLAPAPGTLFLSEGDYYPGIYAALYSASSTQIRSLVRDRFENTILARYGASTSAMVPLSQGLTIASIIERETADRGEMRIISGIIWNRIFTDMRLQMDSTLQYVKANSSVGWWPTVLPKDKFTRSPYNTYLNEGLPPAPIASPSVAAVLAALNPKKTSCFFYFHDDNGGFHCSETYAQHIALLKKYYGQGR